MLFVSVALNVNVFLHFSWHWCSPDTDCKRVKLRTGGSEICYYLVNIIVLEQLIQAEITEAHLPGIRSLVYKDRNQRDFPVSLLTIFQLLLR